MGFDFQLIAERKIQEAIEEGAFDNLPGRGQPLQLDSLPPHLRILRNAGVLPDWMQVHVEVIRAREECDRLWHRTAREYARRRAQLDRAADNPADGARQRQQFADWLARARDSYLREMRCVNSQILKLNLLAPAILREQPPYRVSERAAAFDAEFSPLPGVPARSPSVHTGEGGPGVLRQAAESLYRARGARP